MDRPIFPTLYTINLSMFGFLLFLWYNIKTKHHACNWNGRKKVKGALSFAQGTCTIFTLPFDSRFCPTLPSHPRYMDTACTKVQTWGNLRAHHVLICSGNGPYIANSIYPIYLCCFIHSCVQHQADPPTLQLPQKTTVTAWAIAPEVWNQHYLS